MKLQHICGLSEAGQEEALAMYAAACIYQTPLPSAIAHNGRPIPRCPACAAEVADLVALLRWREEETPFNGNALPLPDDLTGLFDLGGDEEGR